MKKMLMFLMLMLTAIAVMAQPDTTNMVIVTGGESIGEFLKSNMWALIFILYSFVEVWFGQSQIIKEGSFLAWLFNMLGKFIKKQVPTVKGKFMSDEQIKSVRK